MHEQIEFLKRAVTRGDTFGVLNCYVVKGDQITARDPNLQAGAPYPVLIGSDFNVPAAELEAILSRVKSDVTMEHANGRVVVRGRRVKVDIACVQDEPPAVTLPETGWRPIPPGFKEALRLAASFILDKKTNFGVRLMGDRLTVLTNRAGVDVSIEGLGATDCSMLLPAIDFVVSQDTDPFEYHQDAGTISFRWKGDKWIRAQLNSAKFPPSVDKVLASAGDAYPVEITDEWREAYADMSALADDSIEIRSDRMVSVKENSTVEVTVDTPIQSDESSWWSTTSLAPVIAVATHWNPTAWPKPASFKGNGFRGVVVGATPRGGWG